MRSALILDERFAAHRGTVGHPEQPARIECLLPLAEDPGREDVLRLTPREATREEVTAVHTAEQWQQVADSAGVPLTVFEEDTAAGPLSFEVARLAAGGVIELVAAIDRGDAANGLALVRPPGHHAERDRVMGFCLFNNVAVAAAHLRRHGRQRVAIVDWDVHHGNGTQHIFERDPSVLFISLHQFPLYPGTGRREERGLDAGEGTTLNIPLPAGCGDAEYLAAFRDEVLPALREFRPEFLLVSAGFDADARDPLAGMLVTAPGFAAMTERMMKAARELCGDRLALVLEGGYDLGALQEGVRAAWTTLGRNPEDFTG